MLPEWNAILIEMQDDSMRTIKEKYIVLSLFLIGVFLLYSSASLTAQDENYNNNFRDSVWISQQAYLNGRYIPKDEIDAFKKLLDISSQEGIEKFKNAPEDKIRGNLHFKLGGWMAQNWKLFTGSRLTYYLNRKGLSFPDHMIEYLIITFHRYLNDQPLNSDELIAEFIEKRKELLRERLKNRTVVDTLVKDSNTGELIKKNPIK